MARFPGNLCIDAGFDVFCWVCVGFVMCLFYVFVCIFVVILVL